MSIIHKINIALVGAVALLLAGCATPTKYVVDSTPFCRSVAPVCISKDDVLTEGTATGIEANNLGITRVCKVKKTICKPGVTS